MADRFSGGKTYLCIDLKSFYASVECAARGLDPFTTNLVVADPSRTESTICLAITPAMKDLGIRNRCRVFEIPDDVDYIMAPPRMKHYMEVSAQIYRIYLGFVSPDDIYAYSIDECFIDATPYLAMYGTDARGLAVKMMGAVERETGITATAGIGTNLFLAKLALDITAKHVEDHIGYLDEGEFRRTLWHHRPLTDIWNIGPGIARRLAKYRVFDLKGITEMDVDTLYGEFGVNAEYLIDHAWGIEPCTIAEIQAYEPETTSITNGQVLPCGYTSEEARAVMREMVDQSVLELVEKRLVTNAISLYVGYERDAAAGPSPEREPDGTVKPGAQAKPAPAFVGEHGVRIGRYGPHGGGTRRIPERTSSYATLIGHFERLWEESVNPAAKVRRVNIGFDRLAPEDFATEDLFTDHDELDRERRRQEAVLAVKGKFGKNAVLKATSLTEKSTVRERNTMVGGHRGGE